MSQHRLTIYYDEGDLKQVERYLEMLMPSAAEKVNADLVGYEHHSAGFDDEKRDWVWTEDFGQLASRMRFPTPSSLGPDVGPDIGEAM